MIKAMGWLFHKALRWLYDGLIFYFESAVRLFLGQAAAFYAFATAAIAAFLYSLTLLVDTVLAGLIEWGAEKIIDAGLTAWEFVKVPTWIMDATGDVIPWPELLGISVTYYTAVAALYAIRTIIKLIPTIG